jgi:hypothetical protein
MLARSTSGIEVIEPVEVADVMPTYQQYKAIQEQASTGAINEVSPTVVPTVKTTGVPSVIEKIVNIIPSGSPVTPPVTNEKVIASNIQDNGSKIVNYVLIGVAMIAGIYIMKKVF